MKVIFLNPTGILGGAETVLLDLLFSLRAQNLPLEIELILGSDGPLRRHAAEMGVVTHVLHFPEAVLTLGDSGSESHSVSSKLRLLKELSFGLVPAALYMRKLRKLLRSTVPDVLHTNGFKMHILAALVCPRSAGLLWHIHDYVSSRALMALLMRLCLPRCNALIAISHSVAADIRDTLGTKVPIHTVYNGIDLEKFTAEGSLVDLDRASGLSPAGPNTIRVGLVATLAWWKGHRVFLDALALLPQDLRLRAYVIGGPIYKTQKSQNTLDELKSYAHIKGLNGKVGFTGFVEDVASALRALDVVVHASTQPEPFGLVIVQGMAIGKAVITSAAGGAAELIQNGVTALTHAPGDAKQLAMRIAELAKDAGLRAALGTAARESVAARFDRHNLANEVLPIYRQLSSKLPTPENS
jgi:glycosyltransferase involved in cell wall biosynthesis